MVTWPRYSWAHAFRQFQSPSLFSARPNPMISVVIITKDEARNLPGCLDSVSWSDDVLVFDSFSTDGTADIARGRGARVVQRAFTGYASQRNASLDQEFAHPWVLILDADERVPAALAEEMREFVARAPENVAAGRMRRRDFLRSTWLKHSQLSPYFIRLVRPSRVRYEREINEVLKVDGEIVDLSNYFDHYPFSKGLAHWLDKHNQYSTAEARLALASMRGETKFSLTDAFFASDFNQRRFHQKELFYRLPMRPMIKFVLMYFLKRGFLDGRAGLDYAILQATYEQMIVLKTGELKAARRKKSSLLRDTINMAIPQSERSATSRKT